MRKITDKQSTDTGMAAVLIFLLVGYFGDNNSFVGIAILCLVVNMIFPSLYKPIAVVWFELSKILGTVMSNVLLTTLFYLLVTPVGFIRRILGADPMKLKSWKKDNASVFQLVNHRYRPEDLEKPY